MREIEFRGKTENNGEWIFGDMEHYSDAIKIKHDNHPFCKGSGGYVAISSKVIPKTVGQYTGLKDRTGAKIFEGDIVHVWNGEYTCGRYPVVFDKGAFCTVLKGKYFAVLGHADFGTYQFEVLGNIHDNPELLKERL